ncbi:MAG: hypothetical protein VB111_06600 [Clostridiaceae bacterium]|nr:hypothetical protein [Clostridiaceae bacterium]
MKYKLFLLLCILFLALSGCAIESDELLSLPQLPAQYVLVQNQIDLLLSDGVSLSAPVSGTDRASIQMVDLNGDGVDEAIAFCVSKKNESTVPQVYLYRYSGGKYVLSGCIEGVGDSIDTVLYPEMGAEHAKTLVIGWRLGANPVCGLSVYLYDGETPLMLYNGEYTGLAACDLNNDDAEELLVLRHVASTSSGAGSAVLLSYDSGKLSSIAEAPLSSGVSQPQSVVYDRIGEDLYGVVVDALLSGEDRAGEAGMLTDILAYDEGHLYNVTYDDFERRSISTYRPLEYESRDIDGDGIVEVPCVDYLPGSNVQSATPFLRIDWCDVDDTLTLTKRFTAYQARKSEWYFVMPDTLIPSVTMVAGYSDAERMSYVFCEYNSETEQIGRPLWEIFTLTGMEKYTAFEELGLFELARTSTRIYGAKLYLADKNDILSYAELSQSFFLTAG